MGNSGVTLQQDEATSHTAKTVQSWCKKILRFFGQRNFRPLPHQNKFMSVLKSEIYTNDFFPPKNFCSKV